MDRYGCNKTLTNCYRCYLCKENPSFITKEFYDNHNRRFHKTKRYENITRINKVHHQQKIIVRDDSMLQKLNASAGTMQDDVMYGYEAAHELLIDQEKDVDELFTQHKLLSKLISNHFQNNNSTSEVSLIALLETKAKVEKKLTQLKEDIQQLRSRKDDSVLSKKLKVLSFDIKHKEDEIASLLKEKLIIEEELKVCNETECKVNSNKSGDKEMQILFESFAKFMYGDKSSYHGVKDRCNLEEKLDDLTYKMKVLEHEVKSIKEKKHGCEQEIVECQKNISEESFQDVIDRLKNEKALGGKQIEELKSQLHQLKEEFLNERNKNDQLVKDLNKANELVNKLNTEIKTKNKEHHSSLEIDQSASLSESFNEKSKAKLECELKSLVFEKIDCLNQCDSLMKEFTMQLNNAEEYEEVHQLKNEIEDVIKERENISTTINEAVHKIEKLQKMQSSICIKCETDIYKCEQENAEVCEKLKINEKKMSQLQNEMDKANEILEVSRSEANQASNMVSKLEFQQREAENDMKKISKEKESEKQKSLKLASKVKVYKNDKKSQKKEIQKLKEDLEKLTISSKEAEFNENRDDVVCKTQYEDLMSMLDQQKKTTMEEIEKNNLLIKNLNELKTQFKRDTNELEQKVNGLKDRAEKVDKENENLNKDLLQANQDAEVLRNQLKEKQEFEFNASDFTDRAENLDKENQFLNKDLIQAKRDIEILKNELKEKQEFEFNTNDLENRVEKLDKENQTLNKDFLQAKWDLELIGNQLKTEQELKEKVNACKEMIEKEHTELLEEVKMKDNRSNEQFKRITELQSKMLKKDKVIVAKDDLLEAANLKVKQLEIDANAKKDVDENEISHKDEINKQLLEEANSSNAELNKQILLLNHQLDNMTAKVDVAEKSTTESQCKLDDQHTTLVDFQEKYKSFKTQFKCKVNEVEDLKTNIEELKNVVKALEETNITFEENSRKNEAKFERKLTKLKDYCEQLYNENVDLKNYQIVDDQNKETSSDNNQMTLNTRNESEVVIDEKHGDEVVNEDSDWDDEPSLADEPQLRDDKADQQQDNTLLVSANEECIPSLADDFDIRPDTSDVKDDNESDEDISDEESVDFDDDIDDLLNGLDDIDNKRSSGYSPSWS